MNFEGPGDLRPVINSIRHQLPDILGDDWDDFDEMLKAYLDDLDDESPAASAVRAMILDLFGKHPAAHELLVNTVAKEKPALVQQIGEHGIVINLEALRARSERAEAATAPQAQTVTRYTDIVCPRRVWVETPRVAVVVRLTLQPSELSEDVQEMNLQEDLPVRVRINAPAFDKLNDEEQEITLPADADSPPAVFDLRPRSTGPTRVTLDFFQAGNPVGTASVPVEIVAHEVEAEADEPRPNQPLHLGGDAVAPPDLMLYIGYERFGEQPALTFTLIRAGEVGRTFHPVPLQGDPKSHADRLYEWLTKLSKRTDPTTDEVLGWQRKLPVEDVERHLKRFGQNLWRELVPAEFKAVYAAERDGWKDKTLLVVSDEPYFPWELIWPYGETWEDDAPWCATLRLTRWLRRDAQGNGHEAPPARLPFGSLACLAPTDSGLLAAQYEHAYLSNLVGARGMTDLSPAPPTWSKVMDLLEGGGYDWFHVAAHGSFHADAPDADSAIWLEGDRAMTPDDFVGLAIERHLRERRPAFVFNACHSSRQDWDLTRLGGWANRLVSGGAGLFLAPMWTVSDKPALAFAEAFYEALVSGSTIAEATHQARAAARSNGDPTWLAYSVFAHPNAHLALASE